MFEPFASVSTIAKLMLGKVQRHSGHGVLEQETYANYEIVFQSRKLS